MSLAKIKIDRRRIERLPPAKRDVAEQAIRDLEETIERNPLHRYNNPRFGPVHEKQIIFHEMVAGIWKPAPFRIPEVGYMGGNQSGKTTSGIVDCIIQALPKELVPEHLLRFKKYNRPFRCRIGGQGREEIEDFIFEKIKEWCPMEALVGGTWKKAYDSLHHVLHFKNGSFFQFKTYQQEGKQWGGSTLDRVLMDEEPAAVHLKEARIRVMRREGQVLFTMTPVEGLSHTYEVFEEAIEVAEEVPEGAARPIGYAVVDSVIPMDDGEDMPIKKGLVFSDMDDNPWLTPMAKAQALQGLSEEERRARKEGRFVAMSGLIYKRFNRDLHVIDPISKLPSNVNVIVSIDPGFRFATAVGFYYIDSSDNMVMFDELHLKEHIISEVVDQINLVLQYYGDDEGQPIQPMYYIIDSAAANRNNQTGRSDQSEYADYGIPTIPAQKKVTAGINRCRQWLDSGRFHVTSNCEQWLREIRQYRWKKPPKTESDGKEEPVKSNDHQMDQWRYAVMSRPYLPTEPEENNETNMERIVREEIESFGSAPVPVA